MNPLIPRPTTSTPQRVGLWALLAASAALIVGCATKPPPAPPAPPPPAAPVAPPAPPAAAPFAGKTSNAVNPKDYRRDAASHLYDNYRSRVFQGKMPPLLYAVAVMQVEIGGHGEVLAINWMRAPSQAPEVVAEIERWVRQAAPFPRPARMGRVTYTDTWLWHKSGRFQLDTLTEGQL